MYFEQKYAPKLLNTTKRRQKTPKEEGQTPEIPYLMTQTKGKYIDWV
jgi:hypothetical protein